MKKLLSILGFLAVTSTPFISPLQVSTNTEIMINKDNYQLIDLEQQKATIKAFGDYNQELYFGGVDFLAKMSFDGKITQIPVRSDVRHVVDSIQEFNNALYFTSNNANQSELLKISADGKISNVLHSVEVFDQFQKLEVFNNELYFVYSSILTNSASIGKITSSGFVRYILSFDRGVFPSMMKTFNNHLYFAIWNGSVSVLNKIDNNGQIKEIGQISAKINNLINYHNELYLSSNTGSLYKIDTNDEIKTVIIRNLESPTRALVIFQNELYLSNSNKLEKLTKDNKIETVMQLKADISELKVFNGQLYIGMEAGYFAKLV